jgi:hypothetical protein
MDRARLIPNIFTSIFFFYYNIIVELGIHCDIYKSSYNIS